LGVRFFFSKDVPFPSECPVEQCFEGGELALKGATGDSRKSLIDVLFDLLFADGLRGSVPAIPNKLENDADVTGLSASGETGEVHVIDEALTQGTDCSHLEYLLE